MPGNSAVDIPFFVMNLIEYSEPLVSEALTETEYRHNHMTKNDLSTKSPPGYDS